MSVSVWHTVCLSVCVCQVATGGASDTVTLWQGRSADEGSKMGERCPPYQVVTRQLPASSYLLLLVLDRNVFLHTFHFMWSQYKSKKFHLRDLHLLQVVHCIEAQHHSRWCSSRTVTNCQASPHYFTFITHEAPLSFSAPSSSSTFSFWIFVWNRIKPLTEATISKD